jgi:hypothetical protein
MGKLKLVPACNGLTCASPMTSYFEPSSYLATRNVAAVHMVEDPRDIAGLFARGLFTAEAGLPP